MAETTLLKIGADASCSDGDCGEVSRVVFDPVARVVTHLVVEPRQPLGIGRLVPLDLVDVRRDEILLRCTVSEFENLAPAEEKQYVPGTILPGYGPAQALGPIQNVSQVVTYDAVPSGEVAMRRGDQVHATDGDIGEVQGVLTDPRDNHLTHVLLQEGRVWRRKEVAVPIGVVIGVDDGIRLSISRQEVKDLPAADVDHPKQ